MHFALFQGSGCFESMYINPAVTTTFRGLSSSSNGESKVIVKKKVVKVGAVKKAVIAVVDFIVNPKQSWKMIKEEIHHYWMGSKLLWAEMKIAKQILAKVLSGGGMSRRERIQLLRTTSDVFRIVPMSLFIIIPGMELLLPFALKIWPNMLPSTFQDSLKKEEQMKKELQIRFAVANFMQETMKEMAEMKKKKITAAGEGKNSEFTADEGTATELIDFMDKARVGEAISNDAVVRIARLFKDELTLDNISRPQLVSMCRYMGLQAYGADIFLRFQLRVKLNSIKEDDRRILWEGIDSLNTLELKEACRERGMRSFDLTHFRLKKQLQEWLQLSTLKNIPISLLIMSRAFNLVSSPEQEVYEESPESLLKRSMSSLDMDTVNEVVIAAASSTEANTREIRERKLHSIEFQKEMIKEEKESVKGREIARVIPLQALPLIPTTLAIEPGTDVKSEVDDAITSSSSVSSGGSGGDSGGGSGSSRSSNCGVPAATEEKDTSDTQGQGIEADGQGLTKTTVTLTLDEIETLCDLARGSVLHREKSALATLQATLELSKQSSESAKAKAKAIETPKKTVLSSAASHFLSRMAKSDQKSSTELTGLPQSKIVNPLFDKHIHTFPSLAEEDEDVMAEKEDKGLTNLQSVVTSMLDKLKVQLDTTEKALEDKFNLLDQDGDGKLSAEEIRETVTSILNRPISIKEAESFIEVLDTDKDGQVTLVDILKYIKLKREGGP